MICARLSWLKPNASRMRTWPSTAAWAAFGAEIVPQAVAPQMANILTHCNAGSLATVDYGTTLGVVRAAIEAGKRVHVWVDETRPGSRARGSPPGN